MQGFFQMMILLDVIWISDDAVFQFLVLYKSGMSKMRIGQPQPQPQHNQPVKNDHNHNHNHNLTKSHTPTTTSTQFFYDKTPQPQPQPNFFKENTTTQPQHNFSSKIIQICGSTTTLPQNWGKNCGHY